MREAPYFRDGDPSVDELGVPAYVGGHRGGARKIVAPAISSVVAHRPSGTWLVSQSESASDPVARAVMSVRVQPGQTVSFFSVAAPV